MEKYIEENPSNPDREEEVRINKNDISKKKRTGRGFVQLDQVPTLEKHDRFSENEDLETDIEDSDAQEEFDHLEEREMEARRIDQLGKELKIQKVDGAASIYTEDLEDARPAHMQERESFWFDEEKPKNMEEFPDIEKENTPRISRRKTNEPIASMSPGQVNRKTRSSTVKIDKENRHKASINSHDKPTARSWGKRIKDFLFGQNNSNAPEQRRENMFAEDMDREDEVTLNGKPIDKKFLNDENIAA